MIQEEPGNLAAAGSDWEAPAAAGCKETGWTVGLMTECRTAGTEGAPVMGLAVAPGTVGACGAADRVVLLGCVKLKLEGGAALGKETACRVVQVWAVGKGIVVDSGEEPGLAGCNTEPGPENHTPLVPAVHKCPSEQKEKQTFRHTQTKIKITEILERIKYLWTVRHSTHVSRGTSRHSYWVSLGSWRAITLARVARPRLRTCRRSLL